MNSVKKSTAIVSLALLALLLTSLELPALRTSVSQAASGPAPILLVLNGANPNNPLGAYLGEILRAEGLNQFDTLDLSAVGAADLTQHSLTILADTPLTGAQAQLFTNYLNGGGHLLAMRPDAQIKDLFGLGSLAGTLNNGYLLINTGNAWNGQTPGQGLSSATLQIHGSANEYGLLPGAVNLAQLYSNATTATAFAAVVGDASGRAVAFTYDLPSNIAYTRQGNPANANLDVDGDGITRTIDLFQTVGNPAAPWVDRNKIAVPQADQQQRLFARLVQQLVGAAQPLPQLWYFPDSAKTMLILTGDAHANPTSYYQNEINSLSAHGGKITFYMSIAGQPDNATVQAWRAQGMGFGPHVYGYQPNPTYPPYDIENLTQGFNVYDSWWSTQFSIPKSRTERTHQLRWQGWTDAADLAVAHGFALDTNFYDWGAWLQKPDTTWPHGYITGSGQPMKFIRADGTILPLYQQLTQLVDEQLVSGAGYGWENLTPAQAVTVSQQLIDASLAGDYAALMTQFHVDYYSDTQTWAEGTLDYANARGVPIWNADQWLSFVETRHDANYSGLTWNNAAGTLAFSLAATATVGVDLTTILPLTYGGKSLNSVTVDGNSVGYSLQTIQGVNVAFVSVPAGNHSFSALYQVPAPTATPTFGPSPTPTNTPTKTSTPTVTSTPSITPTPGATLLGDQTIGAGQDNNPAGVAEAFQYTAAASGSADQLWIYLDASNTASQVAVGLYSNTGGNSPGTLLTQGTILNPIAGAWNAIVVPGANVVAGTNYWIALLGPVGAGTVQFRTDSQGGLAQTSQPSNLSSLPVSWTAGTTFPGSSLSAYAVHSGLSAPTPTNTATSTATNTATPTAVPPTATSTPTSTPTLTPLPPTATSTSGPSSTPLPAPNSAITQTTFLDFGPSCATLANAHVTDIGGGAVALAATFADNFAATTLNPARWSSASWSGGSYTPSVGGGTLTLPAGGYVRSVGTFTHGSLEVLGQFSTDPWQHIGFASDGFTQDYFVFSTFNSNTDLFARAADPNGEQRVDLGAIPSGFHRYRVDWTAVDGTTDQVTFSIDGVQVAQMNVVAAGAANQFLYLSANGTNSLLVDSAQVAPTYQTSGSYISCVLDAGVGGFWQVVSWNATLPAGTTLGVQTQTSNDGVTWSGWSPVAASGSAINAPARYVQYQLLLSSSSALTTPLLNDISLAFSVPLPTATPSATPLPPTATSTATNTATPTAVPPTATSTPTSTPTLTPLPPTATSTSGPSSTPLPAPNSAITQTTFLDFGPSCATLANAHVTDIGGGAVALAATFADNFAATTLNPARWSSASWSGGSYTPSVGGGTLTLPAGGYVRSVGTFTHGSLEVLGQFSTDPWQHIGFASDGFTQDYFVFSTFNSNTDLFARAADPNGEQRVDLGAIPSGFHRYRVDWTAVDGTTDQVTFSIDGVQVAQMNVVAAGAANQFLYLSANGTNSLLVDSAQVAPTYQTSGSYISCVLDAGVGGFWQVVSWNATLPAGTTLGVQTQTSNDGVTWSGWSPVAASGSAINAPARYVQYQLLLSSSSALTTPLLNDISLGFTAGAPTPIPTATSTAAPATATSTPTDTPVPATATSTPTVTNTPTDTAVPPTATDTPTITLMPPTATNTPTNTLVPPTATNTPTNTLMPPTATNTPTNTLVPPTATNTPTNTLVPPTATNTPKNTPPPPTATATLPPTATPTKTSGVFALPGGSQSFWRFDLTANAWAAKPNALATIGLGGAITYDGSNLYVLRGGGQVTFWQYNLATDTWVAKANTPVAVSSGGALTSLGGFVYAFRGGTTATLWRYSTAANTWAALANAPATIFSGGALTNDGTNLYGFRGNGTSMFWRYNVASNTWTALSGAPAAVGSGGALVRVGNFVYAFRGNGTNTYWRYTITSNTWAALSNAPATVAGGGALTTDGTNIYALRGNLSSAFWFYNISTNTWAVQPAAPGNATDGGGLVYVK